MDDKEYSLIEHLSDLRTRLMRALIGIAILAGAAFAVSEQLLEIIRGPMEDILHEVHGPQAHFIVTGAAEYIGCQMKVAMVAGIFLASPWVLYQFWLFVAPGLYAHEKRYVTLFVWAGAFCFCGGAAFCYFAVFPQMFRFLMEALPSDIQMLPGLDEHFSLSLKMLLAFGAVFETPVFIFILSMAGIVDPTTLLKYRRYVIVISFVIGAILTPTTDPFTQFLLAGPMIFLFEAGVAVSRLAIKFRGKPMNRAAADAASNNDDATDIEKKAP